MILLVRTRRRNINNKIVLDDISESWRGWTSFFLNPLLRDYGVLHLHPAHPNTSSSCRILSFPNIHYFVAFFRSSRCLFNRPFRVCLTHPWTRTVVGVRPSSTYRLIIQGLPMAWKRIKELTWKVRSFYRDFPWFEYKAGGKGGILIKSTGENISDANPIILYKTFLKRFMDDDRLSDSCWNLEMREVDGKREIWTLFWRQFFFFVHQFDSFSFHRLRFCSSVYIPDRSERVYPSFRFRSCLFTPNLVFFFTASCSSKAGVSII